MATSPPGPGSDQPLVFLSHASEDRDRVRGIYDALSRAGVRCWYDEVDLRPGQDWQREIQEALRASTYVLVCLSRSSVRRIGGLDYDLQAALDVVDQQPEGTTFLIPVRLDNCAIPERLARWQWIDVFRSSDSYGLLETFRRRNPLAARPPDKRTSLVLLHEPPKHGEGGQGGGRDGVFLSYRRDDEPAFAGRIYDNLRFKFGQDRVFMDVDTIPWGDDFVEILAKALARCKAMLVVIGSKWLIAQDRAGRRRLDLPDDIVRLEVLAGLSSGVKIIPVLVEKAEMPTSEDLPGCLANLAWKNGPRMTHDGFTRDCAALIERLEVILS
jgi:TIR domain